MPYARNNYTLAEIKLAFRSIDTNRTVGAQGGKFGQQPTPHAHIHGADELHAHPLFARARVTTGDATTHSVMDETTMQNALVGVFNDGNMQPFLQQVDAGNDVHVNVNLGATPGSANVYKLVKNTGQVTTTNAAVVAFFLKIRPNPGNKDVPIIQTCVPHVQTLQLVTKKGKVLGFKH
jgi:hypothetical protein